MRTFKECYDEIVSSGSFNEDLWKEAVRTLFQNTPKEDLDKLYTCDCGGEKSQLLHALWCSTQSNI